MDAPAIKLIHEYFELNYINEYNLIQSAKIPKIIYPCESMYSKLNKISIFLVTKTGTNICLNLQYDIDDTINKRVTYNNFNNNEIKIISSIFKLYDEELTKIKKSKGDSYHAGVLSQQNSSIVSLAFKQVISNNYICVAYTVRGDDPKREKLKAYIHMIQEVELSPSFINKLK